MSKNAEINPALIEWNNQLGLPHYDKIKAQDFMPAFQAAMIMQLVEVNEIAENQEEPTFENTIEALELSGDAFSKVARIFGNLTAAHTNPDLQEVERQMAPLFPQHSAKISSNEKLFKRIDALYQNRDNLNLDDEQMRVLTETWKGFTRQGAALTPNAQKRLAEVNEKLATLQVAFAQNILADEAEYIRIIENKEVINALPESLQQAMKAAAEEKDFPNQYGVTLSRSIIEPFLASCDNRTLREELFKAWTSRGEMVEVRQNPELVKQIVKLRHEKAMLLGFENFAKFRLDVAMAKEPKGAEKLMQEVWAAAKKKAEREAQELSELIQREGKNHELAPWDWRYYAQKLRAEKYAYDVAEVKQYFTLDKMIEAAFYTAEKLFGLTFKEHKGVGLFHEDVRTFEVFKDDKPIAIFIGDYFARASKRSGAWMSGLESQHKLSGGAKPIIFNTLNFAKPPEGSPALLSMDDARTLFHEFGHALHGMLSDVTYPSLSGTSVARDFVELPSQLYEHWLETPQILTRFALHHETGKPIPEQLLQKLLAASTFNSGFEKVEFTASALVDMAVHQLPAEELEAFDPMAFQKDYLTKIGMPDAITMRHATPHFAHAFASEGYAAGYYSYQWSEVLDADAFKAFEETGDVFDEKTAQKLYEHIYSKGGSKDPEALYLAYRGKMPSSAAMLEKAGLV